MAGARAVPLPEFFDRSNAERYAYSPDPGPLLAEAARFRRLHCVAPAATDTRRVHLLLVDTQKDFCFPEGSLFVRGRSGRGAIDDCARTAEFIYRNLESITGITATLDSHLAYQIFFASFWLDRKGRPLAAHREITLEQVDRGEVMPDPALAEWLCAGDVAWLRRQVRDYCAQLEAKGRYRLYLWPPHCLLGSDGHALAGVIQEARLFHSYARRAQSDVVLKGAHPLTESYSVFHPEVLTDHRGAPLARADDALLQSLLGADVVIVAGQAASHCVRSTVEDLLQAILAKNPAWTDKVYLLVDCMSSVVVPGPSGRPAVDFTPQTLAALDRFDEAGMHLVESTEPLKEWPGMTERVEGAQAPP